MKRILRIVIICLNINQLNRAIDTLKEERNKDYSYLAKTLYNRSTYGALNANINTTIKDSIYKGEILDLFGANKKVQIVNLAINSANSTRQILDSNKKNFETKAIWLNKHIIALHDKFVLAFACIVLFFVGAPLGALIRKGGLGLPIVIAMVIFLSYHFFGIFAKKSAEKGSFSPIIGSWLSTMVMFPLSVYLTYRTTNDKGVFQFDAILVPLKRLFTPKNRLQLSESETKSYNYYKRYTVEELVNVIKQQGEYDLDKKPKEIALHNLLNRNIPLENLKEEGLEVDDNLIKGKRLLKDYKDYSKTSLVSFIVGGALLGLHFVFKNNKLPVMADASINLSIIAFIFFAIYVVVDAYVYSTFYKTIGQKDKRVNPILLVLSLPLYPLKYIILRNKIEHDFYQSCIQNIK